MRRNKKKFKHSGWITENSTIRMPRSYIINNCLEPQMFYDDWNDHRDGWRDWISDYKKIKSESLVKYMKDEHDKTCMYNERFKRNQKQKLLLKRRKARKWTSIGDYDLQMLLDKNQFKHI